ncbi:MFS transporter [Aquicella siphonis]|uniref:MFS transporter n=1 Tax=Aquicella siphonis TaxID=254247 RepID=UPI001E53CD9B|nr:MFS transporter [Aquicella siphonis]
MKFVLLMGIVSLFADMTYEGARSITGPYLGTLGANAVMVGFIAGLGEFIGYGFRLFSGFFSDKTGRYWPVAITGYVINLAAVPLLAWAGQWWTAGFLIILERAGKGIRVPARDAMLSHASRRMGVGWGFGIHQALDQAGAMAGPLLVTLALYRQNGYASAFVILLYPALAALSALFICRAVFPNPRSLEVPTESLQFPVLRANKAFWIYTAGASLVAMGYADFALIAYHYEQSRLMPSLWIPAIYALALGGNIFLSPLLGYLYDKFGFIILIGVVGVTSLFVPLVFLGNAKTAILGTMIWGAGLGAQGSLMRAIVADLVSREKRGSGYGIFNACFGLFWFLGSVIIGILYEISITSVVIFSLAAQLISIPVLWRASRLMP